MKTLKQLREQLDFSQSDMAKHLGITRSALSLAERGYPLSADALKKFAVLEVYERKVTGVDNRKELPDHDVKEFARAYQVKEQECLFKADLLEREHTELTELFERNHKAYNILKEMWKDNVGDLKFVSAQLKKVHAKIKTCSEKVRQDMRDKIALLRDTAATYRRFLEESLIL